MPKPGVSNNPLGTLPADAQQRRDQVEEDLACLYRVVCWLIWMNYPSVSIRPCADRRQCIRS